MKKIIKTIVWVILILIIITVLCHLFIKPPEAKEITWGVNFSQKQTELLGLDWKETYLALLTDLEIKNIRLSSDWDKREPEENKYQFNDLDWQIQKAGDYGAKVILTMGIKTLRWPECHIPDWAKNLSIKEQQEKVLRLLEKTVSRYKDSEIISAWQIENEPFFSFGICPPEDKDFFKKEIELISSISKKPIIATYSGEMSFWFESEELSDIVGISMYKRVWFDSPEYLIKIFKGKITGTYIHYPFPPGFYWIKAKIVERLFNKKVIVTELQAEPWSKAILKDLSSEEQEKTMNLEKFKENIDFAKKTGFDEFYFWGGEWWYFMKEKRNSPEIWNEAKKLWQM